ncbi:Mov34/MPN/PAD-1 family protein [Mesobacillus maritimus]|uniref:Mov34/MPN/PAD-1 family protein n=1 Tax=Mesobacillus maritimus TaxID=1643336 RepID=UPI00384BBD03
MPKHSTKKKQHLSYSPYRPYQRKVVADEADSRPLVVHLTKTVYQEIISHCQKELPFEACGLLSGSKGLVKGVWKMRNLHRSPYSFSMDLDETEKVFTKMERQQQQFMGIYHSHPTGIAYPSREDILYNNCHDVVHFIVSLASKKAVVKAFKFEGFKVIPYQIRVTGD